MFLSFPPTRGEIDAQVVARFRASAKAAGVESLVTFFSTGPDGHRPVEGPDGHTLSAGRHEPRIRRKLITTLAPGSRSVSHAFAMND